MYQNILIAVDGSETSVVALREAVQLTKTLGSALCIISVADEYMGYAESIAIDVEVYKTNVHDYSRAVLDKLISIAIQNGVNPTSKLIEVTKRPDVIPESIIEVAIELNADLIVLGTHGRHGFSRLMLGSVAESVVRLSHVPVLLVHGLQRQ